MNMTFPLPVFAAGVYGLNAADQKRPAVCHQTLMWQLNRQEGEENRK